MQYTLATKMHLFLFIGRSDQTFVLPIQFFSRTDDEEATLQLYAAVMHVTDVIGLGAPYQRNKNCVAFKLIDPSPDVRHLYRRATVTAFSTPMALLDLDRYCFTFDGMYRRGWQAGAFAVRNNN